MSFLAKLRMDVHIMYIYSRNKILSFLVRGTHLIFFERRADGCARMLQIRVLFPFASVVQCLVEDLFELLLRNQLLNSSRPIRYQLNRSGDSGLTIQLLINELKLELISSERQ